MSDNKNKICYVIMPFSSTASATEEEWTKTFTDIFRPIIEESGFGYECIRSEIQNGSFTKEIVQNLKTAHLVLADLTDFNLNVMWELGVRHALSKRTIMVARAEMIPKIPSDIRGYGVIPYKTGITNFSDFRKMVWGTLNKIEKEPERSDSPVYDFLREQDLIFSSFEKRRIIARLSGLQTEFFQNLRFAELCKSGELDVKKSLIYGRFKDHAIAKLLSDNYITTSQSEYLTLKTLEVAIHNANLMLDRNLYNVVTDALFKAFNDDIQEIIDLTKESIRIVQNLISSVENRINSGISPPVLILDEKHKDLFSRNE